MDFSIIGVEAWVISISLFVCAIALLVYSRKKEK